MRIPPRAALALLLAAAFAAVVAAGPERLPRFVERTAPDDLAGGEFEGGGAAPRPPGPRPPVSAGARRAPAGAPDAPTLPARTVERVVDGDTVVLDGKEKVRLIGIDTPESVDPRRPVEWYGKEASARTRALLEGKRVRLEHDVERRDRYGRTLAYLYLEDGTQANLVLVEDGYAFAYRYPPNVRYAEAYSAAQRAAREAGRGLWSDAAAAQAIAPKGR